MCWNGQAKGGKGKWFNIVGKLGKCNLHCVRTLGATNAYAAQAAQTVYIGGLEQIVSIYQFAERFGP